MLDLAELLYGLIPTNRGAHVQIDEILERFELDPSDTFDAASNAAESRFKALIRNVNGTDKLVPLISWFVEQRVQPDDESTIEAVDDIISPYGYRIDDNNGLRLVPMSASATAGERSRRDSWLSRHAPSDSVRYLERARDKLGRGDWQEVLSSCRIALEKLTVNGDFTASLDELVNLGIIERGSPGRLKDYDLLKALYGYCSTVGSHAGSSANLEDRSRFGYFATEDAIAFLVAQIKAGASATGSFPGRWRRPR